MRESLFNQYQNEKVKICYLDNYDYFFIVKEEILTSLFKLKSPVKIRDFLMTL